MLCVISASSENSGIMKAIELTERLLSEGCNPSSFSVLSRAHDAYCLDRRNNEWVIFYSERGIDSPPIFHTANESEACDYFYSLILKQEHWHIVGFFNIENDAIELEKKLISFGITPVRNDIPAYKAENDPRYRVFVIGKDIFKVKEKFKNFTVNYA